MIYSIFLHNIEIFPLKLILVQRIIIGMFMLHFIQKLN